MSDFEFLDEDSDDVMMRMQHEDGTTVTFLTAPSEVFTEKDELEPLVYGISDKDVYVAFNSDVIERLISESVEKNGDTYGKHASAFLPISLLISTGLKAVEKYMEDK
jgi:hypothetical protein